MPRAKSKKRKIIIVKIAELAKQLEIKKIPLGTTLAELLKDHGVSYSKAVRVNGESATETAKLKNGDIITIVGEVSGG